MCDNADMHVDNAVEKMDTSFSTDKGRKVSALVDSVFKQRDMHEDGMP